MKNTQKSAIVLFGSPKSDGFTSQLLNNFLFELSEYNVKIINSYKENIHPCTDCGICKLTESCKYNDLDEFDYMIRTADLLIVATPVYNLSFPAPLKSVFDRMQRYFSAKFFQNKKLPIKKRKKAVLLLTSGSDNKSATQAIISQLKPIFTVLNTSLDYTITWNNTDKDNSIYKLIPSIKKIANLL